MVWTIHGHETMSLNVMNNLGLWMIWTTLGHEVRDLDAMNNSVVDMKDFELCAMSFKCYE